MLLRWPIRYKLLLGISILFLIVATLSFSGLRGVYSYRQLVRSISRRAAELPRAAELTASVSHLRVHVEPVKRRGRAEMLGEPLDRHGASYTLLDDPFFDGNLFSVRQAFEKYRTQLKQGREDDPFIGDKEFEWETVRQIEACLDRIEQISREKDWMMDSDRVSSLDEQLIQLTELTNKLPEHLQRRMTEFREEVRIQYRTWILLTWGTSLATAVMLFVLLRLFSAGVFGPLRSLIADSRRVAAGDFEHRIQVETEDEVAELAGAMNAMTDRFRKVRDDLDRQVKERTRELVRKQQLATVGSLAAGVAHEINNPLASIAWCAESLEGRLHDIIQADDEKPDEEHNEEITVLRQYLRTIQDESFRCKGITEKLLDFSRVGDVERQVTDLGELVRSVIDMVHPLSSYRNKTINFRCDRPLRAEINPQEIKQVVLNLLTNALDCIDSGGKVDVELREGDETADLVVADNGCGMTDEVLTHLFEPFFTRRRGGQGTGLGLSISQSIVSDHGGTISAASDGPGTGSRLHVRLPIHRTEANYETDKRAA